MPSRKLISSLLLSSSLLISTTASALNSVKIGFISGRSPEAIVKQWTPLADYLERETGIPFQILMREDYESLIEDMGRGEIDLFEGGALSHVTARAAENAEILAGEIRLGQKTYRTAFVTRANEGARSLGDLRGRRLAFTDKLSTSGYIIPSIMLAKAGIDNPGDFFGQIVFTGSHDRSIEALLEGTIDTAAIGDFFVGLLPADKQEKLKTIALSDSIPVGPITIRGDFDRKIKEKIRQALLDYKKNVPEEMRRVIEIDSFYAPDEKEYDAIRPYLAEFEKLPKIFDATPPYRRIPSVFDERIAKEKTTALAWMIMTFSALFILLAILSLKFRKNISMSVGVVASAFVLLFAAFFTLIQIASLFSTINFFSATKLEKLENMGLRASAAVEKDNTAGLQKIVAAATDDSAIARARIFRNGNIVASTIESEVGVPIMDEIRAGTFATPAGGSNENIIQLLDPIIASGRRYATLQVGISFAPVTAAIRKTAAINAAAMIGALAAGLATALFARRKLARPILAFENAIARIREGDEAKIDKTFTDVTPMAESIVKLGREMIAKDRLENLRSFDNQDMRRLNPHFIRELEERISATEAENEAFRKLRMTEVLGHSPALLCALRDAAIRAHDRDPVVISGPTGSGKTGIARVIHSLSPRSRQKFGEFNCAEFASHDPLVTLGKLFGYGTDCGIHGIDRAGQRGALEEFDGGTVFFDEAEVLPVPAQQLLLFPLEGRPFNPAAGKGMARIVNVRFIFATNEPLEEIAHSGKMRKDLLRRLLTRGFVRVPTLAERPEDIELLAGHFLSRRNANSERKLAFAKETIGILKKFGFDKYNVSELLGLVDQAFDLAIFEGETKIRPSHLGKDIMETAGDLPFERSNAWENYDEEEKQELSALRRTSFKIALAEKHLGYAQGSKTLSNRFRGLTLGVLERSNWDIETTAAEIAGTGAKGSVTGRVRAKIIDYIQTARRNLHFGSTEKIFNNLPKKYHPAAEKFLDAIRRELIKDGGGRTI